MDIVYAADHSFMFFCCVSIYSLMDHLPEGTAVTVHLLIDSSWCAADADLLAFVKGYFPNLRVILHSVAEELFESHDFKDSLWSKATCYRLLLPELLKDVPVCLYLDSDTLIVGDVTPLWETNMDGYCLAGVFEDISSVREYTVGTRIPDVDSYVNAGILLMNLQMIRRKGLTEKLIRSVMDYMLLDQDALNVACYGMIRLLPEKYNHVPGISRTSPVIIHYKMMDYIRPWKNRRAVESDRWWAYAKRFSPVYDLYPLCEKADWYERGSISGIFRKCADFEHVYVVGAGSDAERIERALRLGKCRSLKGILREDEGLPFEKGTLLIVASRRKDIPVVSEYLTHKDAKRQVIRFLRWPLNYYDVGSDTLKQDLFSELLMWEYGPGHRGMASPVYLLELNAVRFPEKEALVEWKRGAGRSLSFRELNKRANRMAAWLMKKKAALGARIALPADAENVSDILASMLGIMKIGCVADLNGEAEITADFSALTDEAVPCLSPGAFAVPDEPALAADGQTITGRELVALSEKLLKTNRICAGKSLTIHGDAIWHGIIELTASFAFGNITILFPQE